MSSRANQLRSARGLRCVQGNKRASERISSSPTRARPMIISHLSSCATCDGSHSKRYLNEEKFPHQHMRFVDHRRWRQRRAAAAATTTERRITECAVCCLLAVVVRSSNNCNSSWQTITNWVSVLTDGAKMIDREPDLQELESDALIIDFFLPVQGRQQSLQETIQQRARTLS